MTYRIGEVAKLAKVSIKTLHHYDAIGLLAPTGRSESGYRLYSMQDMVRLQQILFYRELQFPLEAIHELMTAPSFDYLSALRSQKSLLENRRESLSGIIGLIDQAIKANEEDKAMSLNDMFEVFPEIDPELMDDSERRWGHTDEHKESMRRAKSYTKADWEQLKEERDVLYEEVSALFDEGAKTDDPRVLDVVDRQRLLIDTWHYPCSRDFYVVLTEMTSMDQRFVDYIDQDFPGLASYIHKAAVALAKSA